MNRRLSAVLSVALVALSGQAIFAQTANSDRALTLKDCLELAMQNNVDVLTGRNNVTSARSGSVSARSDYAPQLSLQTNALTWGSQGVLNKTTNGTAFTVTENIFDGGLREAKVQSADQSVKQNQAALGRTVQTVSYNVSKAYCEVLRARHLANVAQANVRYDEGLREQIKARAELGTAANVDVLPIEAQLANARVSLLSAKNKVRTTSLELQRVMGVSTRSDFEIADVSISSTATPNLDTLVEQALKSRPDVLEYSAATKSARASVRQAKINMFPRPTITAEYQRQVAGGFTTGGTQVVGGIVFDIFNGGANQAAYKQARAAQSSAQLQERQLNKDIRSDVEEAYLTLTSAKERIDATAVSLESANKNYSAQKERYSQGLGTTLDLLNAEVQMITAQSDEVEARYDYYIAIAQMDYATGK